MDKFLLCAIDLSGNRLFALIALIVVAVLFVVKVLPDMVGSSGNGGGKQYGAPMGISLWTNVDYLHVNRDPSGRIISVEGSVYKWLTNSGYFCSIGDQGAQRAVAEQYIGLTTQVYQNDPQAAFDNINKDVMSIMHNLGVHY